MSSIEEVKALEDICLGISVGVMVSVFATGVAVTVTTGNFLFLLPGFFGGLLAWVITAVLLDMVIVQPKMSDRY